MTKLNTQDPILNTYVVILVGGKGKRLRPLSNDARPKAFLSVTKDRKTMFRKTLDRALKLTSANKIVVVANKRHSGLVRRDFRTIVKKNLLLEPVGRNTAPAVTFAASYLRTIAPDAIMVMLPTDQYIPDESKYMSFVKKGIDFVEANPDSIALMGVEPHYPATGFGYVKLKAQGSQPKDIYKVEKFTEKPDLATAKRYIREGKYLWNTGAFIFKIRTILRLIREFEPAIYDAFKDLKVAPLIYHTIPDISIDYAVMERAGNIYCIKGSFRWQDMGSFDNIESILKSESRRYVKKGRQIIRII